MGRSWADTTVLITPNHLVRRPRVSHFAAASRRSWSVAFPPCPQCGHTGSTPLPRTRATVTPPTCGNHPAVGVSRQRSFVDTIGAAGPWSVSRNAHRTGQVGGILPTGFACRQRSTELVPRPAPPLHRALASAAPSRRARTPLCPPARPPLFRSSGRAVSASPLRSGPVHGRRGLADAGCTALTQARAGSVTRFAVVSAAPIVALLRADSTSRRGASRASLPSNMKN